MRSMTAGAVARHAAWTSPSIHLQEDAMRAAAFAAAAIVGIGAYLAVATAFALSTAAIGVGVLLIALAAAVAIVVGGRADAERRTPVVDPFDFV